MRASGLMDTLSQLSLPNREKIFKQALDEEKGRQGESVSPSMREADPAFKLELSSKQSENQSAQDESPHETLQEFG